MAWQELGRNLGNNRRGPEQHRITSETERGFYRGYYQFLPALLGNKLAQKNETEQHLREKGGYYHSYHVRGRPPDTLGRFGAVWRSVWVGPGMGVGL
jgi:hypothetical protein